MSESYQKLQENNIFIAKMIGIIPIKCENNHDVTYYIYYNHIEQDYDALPDYTEYSHLMGVVEKVMTLEHFTIECNRCQISSLEIKPEFEVFESGRITESYSLNQAIYDVILAYAKYYCGKHDL